MKSIDLSKAVIIATAINLPAYAIVYFFDIDIYAPLDGVSVFVFRTGVLGGAQLLVSYSFQFTDAVKRTLVWISHGCYYFSS